MTVPANPLYITTPIYYVNAVPHLGTFYTTVVADAFSRYHRARYGQDSTFFLTGLDEHGAKIERIAAEKGQAPAAYCDEIAERFKETWQRLGISYDRFIRTTDADHVQAVANMWKRMLAKGDIYQADYDGLYCVGCEGWKTEEEVVTQGDEKLCPTHNKPVERVKEQNYFFRLSNYADRLLALYQDDNFFIQPESRRNEVAEFVKSGLRDISVSRTAVKWGIPVPGDDAHTIYVWIDALTNYLTALGGPDKVQNDDKAKALWGQSHHLIAKDILRFHAVYWPAMLMSADLPPPRGIFCHGFLNVKGQKISKSIPATRVDPNAIAEVLGPDPLRYFVLREYTFGADGDFSYEALFQRYESDLGNDLGNLLNRTLSMAHKFLGGKVPALQRPDPITEGGSVSSWIANATENWDNHAPSRALEDAWRIVRAGNAYIDKSAPWKMAKLDDIAGVMEVLCNCLEMIRIAALLVGPSMPQASAEILRQLGRGQDAGTWPAAIWQGWPGGTLQAPEPVFPRIDSDQQKGYIQQWMGATAPADDETEPTSDAPEDTDDWAPAPIAPEISYDDFSKIDLRVAKVMSCEKVPKADKLLKLVLNVGREERTVVSGIALAYTPEQMVGRTVVYLANLKPAKIRGVLSQGMILAAGDKDIVAMAALDKDAAPGTKVS